MCRGQSKQGGNVSFRGLVRKLQVNTNKYKSLTGFPRDEDTNVKLQSRVQPVLYIFIEWFQKGS